MNQSIIPINFGFVKAFLIKGDKWILVDTGLSFSYRKMKRILKKYEVTKENLSLIILTHNHLDHVGGLLKFLKDFNVPVLMQEKDALDLKEGRGSVVKPVTRFSKFFFKLMKSDKHIQYQPQIEIKDITDLKPYGVNGKVIPTPGHTDGSISILLDNNDVIVGDLINCTSKKAKYFYVINNKAEVKQSLHHLIELGAKRFITSHSKICDAKKVKDLLESE